MKADVIAIGTVRSIKEREREGIGSPRPYDLSIQVNEYLKGAGPRTITVRDSQGLQSPSCSAFDGVSEGARYLLFLSQDEEDRLRTWSCNTGTRRITDEDEESALVTIAKVNALVPDPAAAGLQLPTEGSGASNLTWTLIAAVALAFVLSVTAAIWRGTRRS